MPLVRQPHGYGACGLGHKYCGAIDANPDNNHHKYEQFCLRLCRANWSSGVRELCAVRVCESMPSRQGGADRSHRGPVQRQGTVYQRKKVGSACQVCRARRTKCDEARPCSFCVSTGASCTSSPVSTDTFDPASQIILEKLHELQSDPASQRILESLQELRNDLKSMQERPNLDRHELRPVSRGASESVVRQALLPASHCLPETLESVLSWDAWGEGAQFQQPLTFGSSSLPTLSSTVHSIDDLDPSDFARYLDSFFEFVHATNPILNPEATRLSMRHMTIDGPGWNAESCFLLTLLANGAMAKPFPQCFDPKQPDDDSRNATALYLAAQKRFGCLPQASYFLQAKCYFYSGVYLMMSLQPFDAWRMFLQGLAAFQSFHGIARNPTVVGRNQTDKNAEESLYWSCWKSERELRMELGLPDFMSSGLDHPRMFPSLPKDCENNLLRSWYFYLSEISLWRMESSTRRSINDLISSNEHVAIGKLTELLSELENPLTALQNSLPEVISLVDKYIEEDDIVRFVLRGRLTYNYELLSWPFIYALVHNQCDNDTTLALAVAGLKQHYNRLYINQRGFLYKKHGTWLMQRSSARSACILVLASRFLQADLMPNNWQHLVRLCISMLEFWEDGYGVMPGFAQFLKRAMDASSS